MQLLESEVDPDILKRIAEPHSKERPCIPFSWMLSYSGKSARQNIRIFENGVRHCSLAFPVRVFFSNWSDAIVVTFVPLEAIREAHILEWYTTFYEVELEEAKRRLDQYPNWPYDGRNSDQVRAEILTSKGGVAGLLAESKQVLGARGITIPPKW
jgi:hypothetical protein